MVEIAALKKRLAGIPTAPIANAWVQIVRLNNNTHPGLETTIAMTALIILDAFMTEEIVAANHQKSLGTIFAM